MFIFLPSCEFLHPLHSCSNGWILFFDFALLLVFFTQSPILLALSFGAFIGLFYGFSAGIPGAELAFQFALGALLATWLLYRFHKYSRPLLPGHFWQHIGETIRLSLLLVIFTFLFYDVDYLLPENNAPYGLLEASLGVVVWLAVVAFVVFRMLGFEQATSLHQENYARQWFVVAIVVGLTLLIGFLPAINSYLKSGIAFVAALPLIGLMPVTRK